MAMFFGILWGFGGLTFGLSIRYLGVALGQSIALGLCAAFGTLIPPVVAGDNLFASTTGLLTVAGVSIAVAGIAVIGYAGALKSREMSEEEKAQAETAGGYAREMSDDYKRRQAALIAERAKAADIVITTALIPGRPAPVLLPEETVTGMKPGSVIVDLAVRQGGNCPLSVKDETVLRHNVKIVAPSNLPATLAADASALYARNLLNFTALLADPKTGTLTMDRSDEIVAATLVCLDGALVGS